MTMPNIGVCSQGHAFMVDHSLSLTGWANRVECPECQNNDRHHFLYDGARHPHLLRATAVELREVEFGVGPIFCGAIGACGHWLNSLMACIECEAAVTDLLESLEVTQ